MRRPDAEIDAEMRTVRAAVKGPLLAAIGLQGAVIAVFSILEYIK